MAEDAVTESGKSDATPAKSDGTDYNSKLDWASVKRVFGIKTNLFIFAQALPGTQATLREKTVFLPESCYSGGVHVQAPFPGASFSFS